MREGRTELTERRKCLWAAYVAEVTQNLTGMAGRDHFCVMDSRSSEMLPDFCDP
jgi:hypothetical protein